jgi:RimJ/RimL family protein N-acetyltransferase
MPGRFCRVEPLDPARHARDLHAANSEDRDGRMWTYLPWGPYAGFEDYLAALEAGLRRQDFVTYAIIAADTGKAVGTASYLNINPSAGSIEVGGITYAPALQRKPAGTENASRCCSPLLPISTPASICLSTTRRNAALPTWSSSAGSIASPRARRT